MTKGTVGCNCLHTKRALLLCTHCCCSGVVRSRVCWLLQERVQGRRLPKTPHSLLHILHKTRCLGLGQTNTPTDNNTKPLAAMWTHLLQQQKLLQGQQRCPHTLSTKCAANDSAAGAFLDRKTPQRSFEPHTAARGAAACVGPASARRFTGLQQQSAHKHHRAAAAEAHAVSY